MNLSPLILDALRHPPESCDDAGKPLAQSLQVKKARRHARVVRVYECPDCDERHDLEIDAEECCVAKERADVSVCPSFTGALVPCPVCALGFESEYGAADCCLWKDIAAPGRWRIVRAVEAGAEWAEAIAAESGDTRVLS